jgi:hypothetical protein
MPRKKRLPKIIHYVQLRTYQQSTYLSYLDGFHSKIKPISYNIDRILNNKWIEIQRPKLIEQFNENYQQEIKKDFLHKVKTMRSTKLTFKFGVFNEILVLIFKLPISDYANREC